jgi:AcrR family transcriptional regulator
LVRAVGTLLARDGFTALGVNAVAKEASVDKVLIYRYFGGMPELLGAFGRSADSGLLSKR